MVRSTPRSVAIGVAVQVEQIDKRTTRDRRACRRDVQPMAEPRKARRVCLGGRGALNSRRADIEIGECDPVAHFYALCDAQLTEQCSVPHQQLEGRVIVWNSSDGLHHFAIAAAADLCLSARHVRAVARWMANFQLKPAQGGVVTAVERAGGPGNDAVMEPAERREAEADGIVTIRCMGNDVRHGNWQQCFVRAATLEAEGVPVGVVNPATPVPELLAHLIGVRRQLRKNVHGKRRVRIVTKSGTSSSKSLT